MAGTRSWTRPPSRLPGGRACLSSCLPSPSRARFRPCSRVQTRAPSSQVERFFVRRAGSTRGQAIGANLSQGDATMSSENFDINELKRRMQGAIGSLKHELGGLRTGRAAASMLEPVQVDAYGTHMPLNQLATVSVPEPRLLSVQVWDKSMVKAVEKAIIDSNLWFRSATEGQVLRLRIPDLNEDRRKELVKVAHKYAEAARVAARH